MDGQNTELKFSKEDIELIAELGFNLRPIDAVARILGVKKQDLEEEFSTTKSEASKAYWGKRELRITSLNKAVLDTACQGSTPAIEKALEILKNLK